MGATYSSAYQRLDETIQNTLNQNAESNALVNCAIQAGPVSAHDNCQVDFRNDCRAYASGTNDALIESIANISGELTLEQKSRMFGLDIANSTQNISNYVRNTLNSKCKTDTTARANIIGERIDCYGNSQVNLQNFADAESACIVRSAVSSLNKIRGNSDNNQMGNASSLLSSSLSSSVMLICLLLIIGVVFIFFVQAGGIEQVGKAAPGFK